MMKRSPVLVFTLLAFGSGLLSGCLDPASFLSSGPNSGGSNRTFSSPAPAENVNETELLRQIEQQRTVLDKWYATVTENRRKEEQELIRIRENLQRLYEELNRLSASRKAAATASATAPLAQPAYSTPRTFAPGALTAQPSAPRPAQRQTHTTAPALASPYTAQPSTTPSSQYAWPKEPAAKNTGAILPSALNNLSIGPDLPATSATPTTQSSLYTTPKTRQSAEIRQERYRKAQPAVPATSAPAAPAPNAGTGIAPPPFLSSAPSASPRTPTSTRSTYAPRSAAPVSAPATARTPSRYRIKPNSATGQVLWITRTRENKKEIKLELGSRQGLRKGSLVSVGSADGKSSVWQIISVNAYSSTAVPLDGNGGGVAKFDRVYQVEATE